MNLNEVMLVLASFEREHVEYALIGGVAVNFHGIPRNTEDLDLFLRPTAENIERLRRALSSVFHDPNIEDINTEELIEDYPAVRYYPPDTDLYLDILTRLGAFASYEDLEIAELDIDGIKVRIVTPRTLYWLKRDTVRDIDRADAHHLKEKFDLEDDPTGSE
jgi:predicted nucleotidyltransferase